MERKLIAQEYLTLISDKNGNLPAMYIEEIKGGILAAALMDMLQHQVIQMEGKKIKVCGPLPAELAPLAPLYEYLEERQPGTCKVTTDYLISADKRLKQLMRELGENLQAEGKAKKARGGFLGRKDVYVPESGYKKQLVEALREAALADDISRHDLSLLFFLKETKALHRYFSPQETAALKQKLKVAKQSLEHKPFLEIIGFMDDIIVLAVFIIILAAAML